MMKSHRPPSTTPSTAHTAAPASEAPSPEGSNPAAIEALKSAAVEEEADPSFLHSLGEALGLGAGFLVAEVLALVPGWNEDLRGEDGAPITEIPGATQIGDHELEKRHQQVVGPAISGYAEKLDPGMWRDFVAGVGEGATDAPGATYRFEAGVSDHLRDTWGKD